MMSIDRKHPRVRIPDIMYAIRIVIPFNAAMFMKEGTLESFDSGDIHGGV